MYQLRGMETDHKLVTICSLPYEGSAEMLVSAIRGVVTEKTIYVFPPFEGGLG